MEHAFVIKYFKNVNQISGPKNSLSDSEVSNQEKEMPPNVSNRLKLAHCRQERRQVSTGVSENWIFRKIDH